MHYKYNIWLRSTINVMYWNIVFRKVSVQQGRSLSTCITEAMPRPIASNRSVCDAVSDGNMASTPSSGQTKQHSLRQVPRVWRGRGLERAASRQSNTNRDVSDICGGILLIYSAFAGSQRPVKEALCHRAPFRSQPAVVTVLKRGLFFSGRLLFRPGIPTLTWKPRLLLQVEGTARGTQEKDWVDWIRVNLLFLTAVCWQGHLPTLWVTGYLECARRTAGGGSPIMTGGRSVRNEIRRRTLYK